MIPEDVISEVKRRADIAAVIGRSVKLKKVGKNLVGLCPFHSEKTPSFNVHPDEGFFYCFGCKATGDVVTFLERTTGRGFLDIVSELAEQTGVELPKTELSPEEAARQAEKKRAFRALELAQVFFRTRFTADEGKPARAYLSEVRKIDEAAIDQFGLGFGGARDDGLATFLVEQGVSIDDAVLAGVCAKNERGAYDFFRHRVTIPIRDLRGRVVSFQGRIFGEREVAPDGSKRPKYVNGPQSPVYDKSAVLFGLHEALPALKKGASSAGWDGAAVLVEGPLDAIAVFRCGVKAAVAPCGTGMTPRHVDEIAQKTERVVVCLDADKAGKEAAARAILMFLQRGLDVGLVALPDKDPDSLVQAGRADELRGLILGAPSAIDAMIAKARERATGNVRARVQALDTLLPFLAAPTRDLVRAEAIKAVARAFNEEPAIIQADVDKRGRKLLGDRLRGIRPEPKRTTTTATQAPQPQRSHVANPSDSENASPRPTQKPKPKRRYPPLSDRELQLAKALFIHPQLAPRCRVLSQILINREMREFINNIIDALVRFPNYDARRLIKEAVGIRPSGQLREVLALLNQQAAFLDLDVYMPLANAMHAVDDYLVEVDASILNRRVGELQRLLAEADERGDHGEIKRILEERSTLVEALKAVSATTHEKKPLAPAVAQLVAPAARSVAALPHESAPSVATLAATGIPADPAPTASPPADDVGEAMPPEDDAPLPEPPSSAEPAGDDAPWAGDPDDDPWAV